MCIGIPMQVERLDGERAWTFGRGARRCVDTALVGPVAVGDWLLVFLDSARECLDARRAAEIDAALNLLDDAMAGRPISGAAAFDLPSAMSAADVAALTRAPLATP